MKIVKADPSHAYHVFKILRDYADDTGTKRPTMENYGSLLSDLLDETKHYALVMHGKMAAGMIWGSASKDKSFTIEGRFLRRKFRNFRFKRALVGEVLAVRKNFDKLNLMLHPGAKVSPRYRAVGLLVEEVK